MMDIYAKLTYIETMDAEIAWDGCHKMYVCETPEQKREAREIGYDLYPAHEVRSMINRSCGLVFVNRWALDSEGNDGFKTDYTIDQFEMPENWYSDKGGVDV